MDEYQEIHSAIADYPDEVYHYIYSTDASNLPICLKGIAARNTFNYR